MEEENGKILNENDNPTQENVSIDYEKNLKEEKEKFFERYNAYKRGLLSIKELTNDEVILAQIMLKEEFGRAKEKADNLTIENGTLEEEIKNIKKQTNS